MGALRLIAVLAHGTLVVGQQMGGGDSMAGGQPMDPCMNFDCGMLSDAMQAINPCCGGGDDACMNVDCAVDAGMYPECCGGGDDACMNVDCAVDAGMYPECCGSDQGGGCTCSDGMMIDEASCEAAMTGYVWTAGWEDLPGVCSGGQFSDEASCTFHTWECGDEEEGPPEW